MTRKTIFTTATIVLTCLTLWTCKKDKVVCLDEQEFCSLVNMHDLNETGPIIDDYLAGLKKGNPHENLEKLADWLECKYCVDKVDVYCKSCIFTNPATSELRVVFISGEQTTTMILSILMDEPQKFLSFR